MRTLVQSLDGLTYVRNDGACAARLTVMVSHGLRPSRGMTARWRGRSPSGGIRLSSLAKPVHISMPALFGGGLCQRRAPQGRWVGRGMQESVPQRTGIPCHRDPGASLPAWSAPQGVPSAQQGQTMATQAEAHFNDGLAGSSLCFSAARASIPQPESRDVRWAIICQGKHTATLDPQAASAPPAPRRTGDQGLVDI